jgi:tRNA(His) 5'-end guanylyltransferase
LLQACLPWSHSASDLKEIYGQKKICGKAKEEEEEEVIEIFHTQEGINHGRQPAGQVKGEQ